MPPLKRFLLFAVLLFAVLLTACQGSRITYGDKSIGAEGAKTVVTVYSDFQCPGCRQFVLNVEPKIISDFVNTGKVELRFRHMIFLGPESVGAAEAAECASAEGKFWAYHTRLYEEQGAENSGVFTVTSLSRWASELGMDETKFKQCLQESAYWEKVRDETQEAEALGIPSTPAVLIDGVLVDWQEWGGDYAYLKVLIDQAVKGK